MCLGDGHLTFELAYLTYIDALYPVLGIFPSMAPMFPVTDGNDVSS